MATALKRPADELIVRSCGASKGGRMRTCTECGGKASAGRTKCGPCHHRQRQYPDPHERVRVGKSRLWLGGLGLFATTTISKGDLVAQYGGIDTQDAQSCANSYHAIQLHKGWLRDGDPARVADAAKGEVAHPGLAQFANRHRGAVIRKRGRPRKVRPEHKVRLNAKLVVGKANAPYLVATRTIEAHEEILINYGSTYKMSSDEPKKRAEAAAAYSKLRKERTKMRALQ